MLAHVVGTSLYASREIAVTSYTPGLPEDIALSVELEKDTYRFGETVNYTLHVANTGTEDAVLSVMNGMQVFCRIDVEENPYIGIDPAVLMDEKILPDEETASADGSTGDIDPSGR